MARLRWVAASRWLMLVAVAISLGTVGAPATSAAAGHPLAAPTADLFGHGQHSLTLGIDGVDTSARGVRIRAYVHRGAAPPGTDSKPPKSAPIYECRATSCAKNRQLVVKHLHDLGVYSTSVYATDSHGHSVRSTAVSQVAAAGIYLGEHERLGTRPYAGSEAVRDRAGRMHLIVGSRYFTRAAHAKTWTITKLDTGTHRSAHFENAIQSVGLSLNGKRVFFVVRSCAGLAVLDAPIGATHLGKPSVFSPADICHGDDGRARWIGGAVAMPHGQVGVLVQSDFYLGRPGGTWHNETLPNVPDNTGMGGLARDAATGEVLAVGYNPVSGALNVVVWSRLPGVGWQGPATAASLPEPSNSSYETSGIVADRGDAWIVASRSVPKSGGPPPPIGPSVQTLLLLARHGPAWSAPAKIPRSLAPAADKPPVLAINPATHHVHVAYSTSLRFLTTRHTRSEGIVGQTLNAGAWSSPRYLTHYWGDTPQNMMFNDAGHVVIVVSRVG